MFDIIGDIHGFAGPLRQLLEKLGYTESDGVYRHPERQVIFVGDFIDKGTRNLEVVRIARRMVESGSALAVMGNHEFNAWAYHTKVPGTSDEYLRPHTKKNEGQHEKVLREVREDSEALRKCIDWFSSLPLFLDLPGLRVIHACWDQSVIDASKSFLNPDRTIPKDALVDACRKGSLAHQSIELLLKGPEVELPTGCRFNDKYGATRTSARIKWWRDPEQQLFDQLVVGIDGKIEGADAGWQPDWPVTPYPSDAPPVFFGHYWFTEPPEPVAANMACLDYSVADGGDLVAYRWDGEVELSPAKMVRASDSP